MPFDPNAVFETVSHAISKFPPALFAAALLGGPTLIWLIVRFASPPTPRKRADLVGQELLWVCGECRSINDDRLFRCYSCHRLRAADLIPVVSDEWEEDDGYELEEGLPEVGIPVGPGLPAALPTASSWLGTEVTAASDATFDRRQPGLESEPDLESELETELELEPELDVAVGSDVTPRVFEPVVIEPRLRVSAKAQRSPSRSEPRSDSHREAHPEAHPEPRTGLRSTTRPAPRGRWTDLPPAERQPSDPPEAADEAVPKRRAGGRRSAGG